MRKSILIAIAVAALSLTAPAGAKAQAYWPWCAYYDAWTYNCGFATLGQCLATTSGVGGACRPNPYGPPVRSYQSPRRYKRVPR
jgi:hypothetical protein